MRTYLENDITIYSFDAEETKKLIEIKDAFQKTLGYPYLDTDSLLRDPLTIKIVNVFIEAYIERKKIQINYPKEVDELDIPYTILFNSYFYMLFRSFRSDIVEKDYIENEKKKYTFTIRNFTNGDHVFIHKNGCRTLLYTLWDRSNLMCIFNTRNTQKIDTEKLKGAWFNLVK